MPDTAAPARPALRREILLGALVVLLTGGGTLAMLAGRDAGTAPISSSDATTPLPTAAPLPSSTVAADRSWLARAPRWEANPAAWLGRSKGVAFEVSAAEPIGVWMRTVRPALVVRCTGKRTDVFVFTDSAAMIEANTDDHTVSFAFDDDAPVTVRWPDGAEHNALFAPDGAAVTRRLLSATTFTFSFTPHNAGRVTARFHTADLQPLLTPALKHCW